MPFVHTDKSTFLRGWRNRKPEAIIAPSLLACDFGNVQKEIASVTSDEGGNCEWLHWDHMDGHFVPNISLGPGVVESARQHFPHAFFDCHLMVSEPEKWVESFAKAGASQYTFHIEAAKDPVALIQLIRDNGMQVGVALKPKTPASAVFDLIDADLVDMVLVMTVEPGFGGQSFMTDMMPKVAELRHKYPTLWIEVDGGLGLSTIEAAAKAGANVIVAGTSVFRAKDRAAVSNKMRDIVTSALHHHH